MITSHPPRAKDRLYQQFTRMGKALASPHRLECLELLAQGERTVESLAADIGATLVNTSQHLRVLSETRLVERRKQALFVYYRLADPTVFDLCAAVRHVAERRLTEMDQIVKQHFSGRANAQSIGMTELQRRARSSRVVILDTRLPASTPPGISPAPSRCRSTCCPSACMPCRSRRCTSRTAAARTASMPIGRSTTCAPVDDGPIDWLRGSRSWRAAGYPVEITAA